MFQIRTRDGALVQCDSFESAFELFLDKWTEKLLFESRGRRVQFRKDGNKITVSEWSDSALSYVPIRL